MHDLNDENTAGANTPRRLFVFNGGFLSQGRVRRILELSNWDIKLGKPGADDWVGVWGKSPTSGRGEAIASATDTHILLVEDSFLRSVLPGRAGQPPIGLNIDRSGVHFDSSAPSDLEKILTKNALDDTAVLNRARDAMARLQRAHLSKYNAFDPDTAIPPPPYVLVIDQSRDDASIKHGGSSAATFKEMLVFALTEHPGSKVIIKGHPDVSAGYRQGHFSADDNTDRVTYLADAVSPWSLLDYASAVYTVSSQMGFEAIIAGHKPRVFGQPFYSGWGLTADENPVPRRERKLTRAQLFAGAMILYPTWYDPFLDRLCSLEDAIDTLECDSRRWRDDHRGYVALGMKPWKQGHLRRFFGRYETLEFASDTKTALAMARKSNRPLLVWASAADAMPPPPDVSVIKVEDGFIRSRGLGAKLVDPLSLVLDDLGIYYDPKQASRLETLISNSPNLPQFALRRAENLRATLIKSRLSKYNLPGGASPTLPEGFKILVPGQVEDDASVRFGCSIIKTNAELLALTRKQNPDAVIIYKPHPDVLAGLRKGLVDPDTVARFADLTVQDADPVELIEMVDVIWTMTSTLGFEALIRGKPVTCLGVPFYAGWGLTTDLAETPKRRVARPGLDAFLHACLIDYPRYFDPISKQPCTVEIALERLENGPIPGPNYRIRALSRLQSVFRGLLPVLRR